MTAHTAITAQDVCAWPVFGDERLAQNFWDKLVIEQNSGCWLWTAAGNTRGYGNAYANGAYINAHKLVFEALVGKVPAGLQLDHLCRVRCCANPSHLEIVTPRENTLRGNSQSAHQARATHCQNGHEFKAPRLIGGKLSRRCRECDRQREARYRKAVRSSDRGDGYHANDPAAPVLFRCDGCDAPRETEARCFCPDCNEVTGCYSDRFDAFNEWVSSAPIDRRTANAHIDAGMAALNAKQAARWEEELRNG